jgi:hypothetical protein
VLINGIDKAEAVAEKNAIKASFWFIELCIIN